MIAATVILTTSIELSSLDVEPLAGPEAIFLPVSVALRSEGVELPSLAAEHSARPGAIFVIVSVALRSEAVELPSPDAEPPARAEATVVIVLSAPPLAGVEPRSAAQTVAVGASTVAATGGVGLPPPSTASAATPGCARPSCVFAPQVSRLTLLSRFGPSKVAGSFPPLGPPRRRGPLDNFATSASVVGACPCLEVRDSYTSCAWAGPVGLLAG